jgi:hypothetical protein
VKVIFQLVSHLVFQNCFSNWYLFQNPLESKGENSFRGSFYLITGKAFEIGGEISNLKNASCNRIPIPLTICKKVLKGFFQKICKNK